MKFNTALKSSSRGDSCETLHFLNCWKKIDSKNGLKVERKSRKMLVFGMMHCVFLALFSWHIIAQVFLMNVQKGLIQINWELGERDVAISMKVSKTKFWSHMTQQQMRSKTSNTHRCNRNEDSFGRGGRIGSIRTSLHLQNREKHPRFQHFQHFAISTCVQQPWENQRKMA